MTSDPRRTAERQHQLRGNLGQVTVGGKKLDQWQVEPTAGGHVWYAIDDEDRVLWATQAGIAHPKETEARRQPRRRWSRLSSPVRTGSVSVVKYHRDQGPAKAGSGGPLARP
jgi:hypothetical protein